MTDTAIVSRTIVAGPAEGVSTFSWGAATAGAVAATAVSFILIALGSGIGMLAASPYGSGPSLTTLTVAGAAWIVLAQTWGFAVGGYLAGRLRTQADVSAPDEVDFRDGAHGFVSWGLGVLLTLTMVAAAGMFAVGLTGHVASTVGAGAAVAAGQQTRSDPSAYFADSPFRTASRQPGGSAAPQGETPATMQAQQSAGGEGDTQARAEVGRIMTTSLASGQLSDDDRAYLARMVSARTGLSPDEANRRVTDVENRMRTQAKEAADKAAKAAAMLSFWTFMSLLMGAAAAVVGGIVGGNHRDENLGLRRVR